MAWFRSAERFNNHWEYMEGDAPNEKNTLAFFIY